MKLNPLRSLSSRLLLFNILILFLPLGSLLFLDTYENQLLASQENSMIQQGRILSSALSGLSTDAEMPDAEILAAEAARILENLRARVDSRLRVVDSRGRLLADSARLPLPQTGEARQDTAAREEPYQRRREDGAYTAEVRQHEAAGAQEGSANENWLYRAAVYPVNLIKKFLLPPPANFSPAEFYSGSTVLLGPEINAALEGRYGAATRISSGDQASVTLYSAIPITGKQNNEITGAVLVSRSSYNILLNLYRVRFEIIKIFFISIAISLALSLGLSFTITVPVKKLKNEAERVLDKSGHFREHFRGLRRKDEIGDLSRSLSGLSQKLEKRIAFIDNFTSDLLHELKNPMAAIRAQTELAIAAPEKEAKLLEGIRQEEGRMERLLARLRELSRIDNILEREETARVDLCEFLPAFVESRARHSSYNDAVQIIFEPEMDSQAAVRINTDRLIQALSNPLDNAVSFSPPNGTVRIGLRCAEREEKPAAKKSAALSVRKKSARRELRITVDDEGPGIREESGSRCFERFYSERPESGKEKHSGLGLAITQAIAEGCGGSCSLENRRSETGAVRGCRFTLILPAVAG